MGSENYFNRFLPFFNPRICPCRQEKWMFASDTNRTGNNKIIEKKCSLALS
jgi:hypothetical protein